ncbi:hypothetical protein HAX54_011874 [Datura stramonium]|uniref:Uncharacterized protein n=1 Tax=Datura stramonium TaxID=4076 RepID=A0ABS8TIU2_DATST|nr:hypothetical protein [Datura stramonium]
MTARHTSDGGYEGHYPDDEPSLGLTRDPNKISWNTRIQMTIRSKYKGLPNHSAIIEIRDVKMGLALEASPSQLTIRVGLG